MPTKDYEAFKEAMSTQKLLSDPITGCKPSNERELSASLASAHLLKKINWDNVALYKPLKPDNEDKRWTVVQQSTDKQLMSELVCYSDFVFCEYPLFTKGDEEISQWGQMSADILFVRLLENRDAHLQSVTLVECKIDSHFTYSDHPTKGQISRYLKYLNALPVSCSAHLVLACPYWNHDWYAEKMSEFIEGFKSEHNKKIEIYMMLWDGPKDSEFDKNIFDGIQD